MKSRGLTQSANWKALKLVTAQFTELDALLSVATCPAMHHSTFKSCCREGSIVREIIQFVLVGFRVGLTRVFIVSCATILFPWFQPPHRSEDKIFVRLPTIIKHRKVVSPEVAAVVALPCHGGTLRRALKIQKCVNYEREKRSASVFTLSCCVICWCAAWLLWCFCMSTAASASALLNKPSFRPEKMSPCKESGEKLKI